MNRSNRRDSRYRRLISQSSQGRPDFGLILCVLILLVIGVIMVYEASVVEAFSQFGDRWYFARLQFKWASLGLITFILSLVVPMRLVKKMAVPFLGLATVLLLLVLIPGLGITVGGAQRWLNLGFFSLQPSEVAKLAVVIYLAALFEKNVRLGSFLAILGMISLLIMLQPDMDTTMIIVSSSFALYFLAGAAWSTVLAMATVGIGLAMAMIISSPYRRSRLLTFMDPDRDPLGASYHIHQIILSLGSGGWFGRGFGRSLQKYDYLPEATTDSIFAVIAEETGFVGSLVIVGLFAYFLYRGLRIATRVEDRFLKLLAMGLTILIVSQALLNLGAMAALLPLSGITLPFISYGGSSLIISLACAGLLINISRYRT